MKPLKIKHSTAIFTLIASALRMKNLVFALFLQIKIFQFCCRMIVRKTVSYGQFKGTDLIHQDLFLRRKRTIQSI